MILSIPSVAFHSFVPEEEYKRWRGLLIDEDISLPRRMCMILLLLVVTEDVTISSQLCANFSAV